MHANLTVSKVHVQTVSINHVDAVREVDIYTCSMHTFKSPSPVPPVLLSVDFCDHFLPRGEPERDFS